MKEIIEGKPLENYELLLVFENKERRIKDMKPYLEKGIFKKLKDKEFFKNVKVLDGAISWENNIEMCADSLYITSKPVDNKT